MEPKDDKKKSSAAAKIYKKSTKKRKREDSYSSVVESSEESTKACRPNKKYCNLQSKCSHSTDGYKDLCAMTNEHKQKKKNNFRNYGKRKKEINALIEKKIQKFVKNKKKEENGKRAPALLRNIDFRK